MIELINLYKSFSWGNDQVVNALDNVNLTISQGEYVVLVGANGSGKSSLLNALAGLFRVDKGQIKITQNDITQIPDYQRSRWISRIFQNPLSGTASDLSVLDNFRLASLRTQRKSLRIGVNARFKALAREKIALLEMGLENKLEQKMGTLSGGQRQALTLIMAIMDEAKILLMDEPTAALDPKSAQNLMEKSAKIIGEFNLTTILVTHDLKDAYQYGNRIIQMQEGKIIQDLNAEAKSKLNRTDLFEWFT